MMVAFLLWSGRIVRHGIVVSRYGQHLALAPADGATRSGGRHLRPQPNCPPALQASLAVQDTSSS